MLRKVLVLQRFIGKFINKRRLTIIMLKQYPDVLTTKDLMKILHHGKNKIYELLKEGKLPYIVLGKKYLISKEDVIKYIRSNKTR